jgi:SLT domain-containing protein
MPDDPQQLSSEQQFDALMRSGASVSGVASPPPTMPNYEQMLESAAAKHGVDYNLARALMRHESAGNPHAVSNKGAQGLMQLMPDTARGLGVTDPFDPEQNIDAGIRYLKQQMDNFSGDPVLALAAYNAGPEAVRKYGGVPPYHETQDYVSTIMGRYRQGDSEQHLEQILNQPPQEQAEGGASDSEQQFDQMMATEPAGPPKPQFTISATKEDQPPAHPLARAGWWLEKHIGDAEVPGMTLRRRADDAARRLGEDGHSHRYAGVSGNRNRRRIKQRALSWRTALGGIFGGLGDNIMQLVSSQEHVHHGGHGGTGAGDTAFAPLVDAGFSVTRWARPHGSR